MKIIDLLNKIAKGEELPKKIKYGEVIYILNVKGTNYIEDDYINRILFDRNLFEFNDLNDEVEIIEEDKKIEKISWKEKESLAGTPIQKEQLEILARRSEKIKKVLNELIDEVNKIKESI